MLKQAIRAASESVFYRARTGAVIAKGKRILSTGHNRIGYSKWLPDRPYPESIHAEQDAIIKLLKKRKLNDLAGATIYVSRVNSAGAARLAKPCVHCANLIRAVGISAVVYTTNDGVVTCPT